MNRKYSSGQADNSAMNRKYRNGQAEQLVLLIVRAEVE